MSASHTDMDSSIRSLPFIYHFSAYSEDFLGFCFCYRRKIEQYHRHRDEESAKITKTTQTVIF